MLRVRSCVHGRARPCEDSRGGRNAALAHIRAEWQPDYEPVVVHLEDAGFSWRVFYNDEKYLRTEALGQTLIDNWPS